MDTYVAVTHTGGIGLKLQQTTHTLSQQVGSESTGMFNGAIQQGSVRRLTPVECERLQALPDQWTQLGRTPDSKRYAALGDAVTATVAEWIGRRLLQHLRVAA